MIELERTFLAQSIPADLSSCPAKVIRDLYVDNGTPHADLRLRQNGDDYEMTRKRPVSGTDSSKQLETTIELTAVEWQSLAATAGKKIEKTRYYYPYQKHTAEFDVFIGDLAGLVLIDFEFTDEAAMHDFKIPEFCLADITQEEFIAGGVLAGKSYTDIANHLQKYKYQKLELS